MVQTLAYLDPGSGSLILQAFIGGTSGFIVLIRYLVTNWFAHPTDASKL